MTEYFITMAVLLLCYPIVRYAFLDTWRLPPPLPEPIHYDRHPIDTTQLASRIQHIREEMTAPNPSAPAAHFKRALRVESKREQLAKLPFFQPPPPPPPEPENEQSSFLLLA